VASDLPGIAAALRLTLGSIARLPLGLNARRHADPVAVRRLIGATILAFTVVAGWVRLRGPDKTMARLGVRASRDLAVGVISGAATTLVGMVGPPVLIYLLLARAPPPTVRAKLLVFRDRLRGSVAPHPVAVGISGGTWIAAAVLIPFRAIAGRPLGDRLGVHGWLCLPFC